MSFTNSELIYFFFVFYSFFLRKVFPVNCFRQWNNVVLFYTSVKNEKRMKCETREETIAVSQAKDLQTSMLTTRRLGIVVKCL